MLVSFLWKLGLFRPDWNRLVEEFLESKAARRDDKTVDWYRARLAHLLRFVAERDLNPRQVTAAELDLFLGRLKRQKLAASTRKGTLIGVSAFFTFLRDRRYIKSNPFDGFEPVARERTVVEPLDLSTAYRMIHAAEMDRSPYGVRDAAMMRLLLSTGARREELTTLRLDCLFLEANQLIIRGKFDHERLAFLLPATRLALERWLAARPACEALTVFVTLHPDPSGIHHEMRPDAINDLLVKWRTRAGLPKRSVSPHHWRHLFATELGRSKNPFALQVLLGHADISTTSGYVHANPATLADLVQRYAPDVD